MKKPVFIRVIGWLALAAVVLPFVVLTLYHPAKDRLLIEQAGSHVIWWLGLPCFLLWALLTGIFRLMLMQQAAGLAQGGAALNIPRLAPGRAPGSPRAPLTSPLALNHPAPPAQLGAVGDGLDLVRGGACEVCGSATVAPRFHCCRHEITLCFRCVCEHDARLECYYIPAGRAPRDPAARAGAGG